MKRHILGLALFFSIIGAAILVSQAFYTPVTEVAVTPVPTKEVIFTRSKTSCWKDAPKARSGGVSSVKVLQAVFNEQTKQLDTELLVEGKVPAGVWVSVNLHFFKKGAGGTRYLASESLSVVTESAAENESAHSVVSSFAWLDSLASHENIYVVAEPVSGFGRKVEPSGFDEAKARPVLLMGKN